MHACTIHPSANKPPDAYKMSYLGKQTVNPLPPLRRVCYTADESEVFPLRRKKVWIIVLCAVLGTLLLIGGLLALLRAAFPTLYYRIYPFDRITGTVTVTVDGKPYLLRADEFSKNQDVFHGTPRFSVLGGTAHVRIRGGEKEPYGFMLKIDGVEHSMRIGTFHFNWWDVTKFDLSIAVDTTAKTVTMQSSTQQIGNDGSTLHSTQTETFSLSDPEISFGFGEG